MLRYAMVLSAVATLSFIAPSAARAQTYDFGVESKFVNITFESKADVEDILGTSASISGTVRLDPKGSGSFRLVVPVASMKTGIDLRDEHLRSAYWLDAEKYPNIVFEGEKLRKLAEGKWEVAGKFSLHGVTKPLTVTVDTSVIPKERAAKANMGEVEWLRVRGEFSVRLSDFGVKIPDGVVGKVNDSWTVRVSLFGKKQ